MKKILCLLLVSSSMFSMQLDLAKFNNKVNSFTMNRFQQKLHNHLESNIRIEQPYVFIPSELDSVELYHSKKGFSVVQDGKTHRIKSYFTDPVIRNIKKVELRDFLSNGYLSLDQMTNGDFSITANSRLDGNGPKLGIAAYWITKSICWGVVVAGTTAAIVGTAGTAIANKGDKLHYDHNADFVSDTVKDVVVKVADNAVVPMGYGGAAIVAEGQAVMVSTAPIAVGGIGVGVVAGTIKALQLQNEAQAVTALAIGESAKTIGLAGAIEALSLKVGLFFGLMPTP